MSGSNNIQFVLPGKLEKIFAALSLYYEKVGLTRLQQVLVNSEYSVDEGREYNKWDSGRFGHAVSFYVPSVVYLEILDDLNDVAEQIREGISKLANVSHEYVSHVLLELQEDASLETWR